MHSSILLDADPNQLEPFPLALIMNEKEEARHLKSSSSEGADNDVVSNVNQNNQNETNITGSEIHGIGNEGANTNRTTVTSSIEIGGQSSSASESEAHTPIQQHSSMPHTPLTASAISANIANTATAKLDHYSNISILTPASSGAYSTGSQMSSVSSPAQESPFIADTPHTNNLGNTSSGYSGPQSEDHFD